MRDGASQALKEILGIDQVVSKEAIKWGHTLWGWGRCLIHVQLAEEKVFLTLSDCVADVKTMVTLGNHDNRVR